MSFEVIKTDQTDRVAVVTLNRPEVLNALNLKLVTELDQFITQAEEDDDIGAVVITGAGERAFSAGPISTRTGSYPKNSGTIPSPPAPGTPGICSLPQSPSSARSTGFATGAARSWSPASTC